MKEPLYVRSVIPTCVEEPVRYVIPTCVGEPLYVRYVIPTQDVVDYRERITGIRAWHLTKKNGAVSFEQAQANVNAILKDRLPCAHACDTFDATCKVLC